MTNQPSVLTAGLDSLGTSERDAATTRPDSQCVYRPRDGNDETTAKAEGWFRLNNM